jgi:hypothetical protein
MMLTEDSWMVRPSSIFDNISIASVFPLIFYLSSEHIFLFRMFWAAIEFKGFLNSWETVALVMEST